MNLLDRFLAIQPIAKRHLQLLGTVCMFIAAKLKCSPHYSAETLAIYTANSVTVEQLLGWEQLVMQRLRWDVQSVLAVDIIPHLLARLNLSAQDDNGNENDLHTLVSNFICACATEFKFSVVPASMIATSCLYLALQQRFSLEHIHRLLGNTMDFECLIQCVEQIHELLSADYRLVNLDDSNSNVETLTTTTSISTTTITQQTEICTTSIIESTHHHHQQITVSSSC